MNHKVQSVQLLHENAKSLLDRGVKGTEDTSADTIIENLTQGIETLKNTWKGKDAGVQIENLVVVLNAMVAIRNVLGKLAVDSSKIAGNYREIQNSNGAGLESLGSLVVEDKTKMADYSDDRDTIEISSEANNGKARVDAANNGIDGFIANVETYYNDIINNWSAGPGRDEAVAAFDEFMSKSREYKQTLGEVSSSISTAIKNYSL